MVSAKKQRVDGWAEGKGSWRLLAGEKLKKEKLEKLGRGSRRTKTKKAIRGKRRTEAATNGKKQRKENRVSRGCNLEFGGGVWGRGERTRGKTNLEEAATGAAIAVARIYHHRLRISSEKVLAEKVSFPSLKFQFFFKAQSWKSQTSSSVNLFKQCFCNYTPFLNILALCIDWD